MTPRAIARLVLAGALAAGLATAAGVAGAAAIAPASLLDGFEPLRLAALGGAGAAVGYDPTLIPANPASCVVLSRTSLTLGGQRGFFGDMTGHGFLAFPCASGVVVVGGMYYASPPASLHSTDGTVRRVVLQQDIVSLVSYCGPVGSRVSAGASLKVLHSELFEEYATLAPVADLGIQVKLSPIFKLGAAIRNAGPSYRYFEDAVAPPTEVRLGLAGGWRVRGGEAGVPADSLIVVTDLVWNAVSTAASFRAGAEYRWLGLLAFRAGFQGGGAARQLARLAAGLGFANGPYRLDYAVRFDNTFEVPQALALTVSF